MQTEFMLKNLEIYKQPCGACFFVLSIRFYLEIL